MNHDHDDLWLAVALGAVLGFLAHQFVGGHVTAMWFRIVCGRTISE